VRCCRMSREWLKGVERRYSSCHDESTSRHPLQPKLTPNRHRCQRDPTPRPPCGCSDASTICHARGAARSGRAASRSGERVGSGGVWGFWAWGFAAGAECMRCAAPRISWPRRRLASQPNPTRPSIRSHPPSYLAHGTATDYMFEVLKVIWRLVGTAVGG